MFLLKLQVKKLAGCILRVMSLQKNFSPSKNSFNFLRLLCASVVLFSHTGWMAQHDVDWLRNLGPMAVIVFFGISGFLLARSLTLDSSTYKYLVNRFLRIYPGFLVMVLVTALLLAPLTWVLSGQDLFDWNFLDSLKYVVSNSLIHVANKSIGATPLRNELQDWNPSIWTLQYEVLCYLSLLLLFLTCHKRSRKILMLSVFIFLNYLLRSAFIHNFFFANFISLFTYFMFGTLAYLFSNFIPTGNFMVFILALVIILSSSIVPIHILQLSSLILFTIILSTKLKITLKNDYSYGLYIYGGPATNLALIILAGNSFSRINLNLISFFVAFLLAFASWHLVEKPALQYKL